MNVLGLIPARGGSKGIPRKNLVLLGGKPLLAHACEAALASTKLDRIVLSTDDEEIAELGKECGVEVPFLRPTELAADDTPMVDVIRHAIESVEDQPDAIVLLQPTSPLRRAEHIDAAVDLLEKSVADCVVSVVEVPHQYALASLMRMEGERIVPLEEVPLMRQEKARVYARNGPAVLALRTSPFLKVWEFYSGNCRPLVMDRESSVDIDDEFDLAFAEFLLQSRKES